MNRRVALKLPRSVWGEAFAERLAREREILATLEHEHIARLYDAGLDAQGRPFLAMECVDGEPLDAYLRTHALSIRERVVLLLQVMSAVSHAHARLVVHRDLKPGNILVTPDAKVKLLDFGIAKLLEGEKRRRLRDMPNVRGWPCGQDRTDRPGPRPRLLWPASGPTRSVRICANPRPRPPSRWVGRCCGLCEGGSCAASPRRSLAA